MWTRRRASIAALALLQLPVTLAAAAGTDDWPQFRGPNRDGISAASGINTDWAGARPPELWRVPLGKGYSGMAVLDGRVVTMFGNDEGEYAAAYDAASGTEIWRARVGDLYRDGQGDGPRSTPTLHGGAAFVLGARGDLAAFDIQSGRPLWHKDLRAEYGARPPTWGFSSSSLVIDGQLVVETGGSGAGIVAFEPRSGTELWRALDDRPGYSAPIYAEIGSTPQLVFFTANRVVGIAPTGGSALWSMPWRTDYDVNAATPIFVPPDRVLVASGYGVGASLLRITGGGANSSVEPLWHSSGLKNQFSSSVLVEDTIYGFDNSLLVAHQVADGERLWRARGYGHGSLIFADGHLIVLGDGGTLGLVRAAPGEYQELARYQVFDTKTWTPPSLAQRTLYLRDERELVAIDLRPID